MFDMGIVSKEQEIIVKHTLYTDGTSNTIAMGELVRCRDCHHWSKYPGSSAAPQYHECMARMTHIGNLYTKAEEFCSRGERKDGDHAEGTIQKERS